MGCQDFCVVLGLRDHMPDHVQQIGIVSLARRDILYIHTPDNMELDLT